MGLQSRRVDKKRGVFKSFQQINQSMFFFEIRAEGKRAASRMNSGNALVNVVVERQLGCRLL